MKTTKPLVASIALLLASVSARAQGISYSWIGSDNGNWNVSGNWNQKGGFPNGSTDSANFNGTGTSGSLLRVNVNGSFAIGTVNITDSNTTGAGFNLKTGTLTFPSGGLLSNSTNHSIVGSNLALSNFLFVSLGSATSNLDLTGTISGTGQIQAYNSGNLVLTGNNTFTGGVSFFGDTLEINSNAALGAASGTLIMGSGSTLLLNGNVSGGRVISINGRQLTRSRRVAAASNETV